MKSLDVNFSINNFFIFILIVMFLASCSSEQRTLDIEQIKISLENEKDISIFDICSNIEIVPLETSDSILLSIIYVQPYLGNFLIRQNNPQQVCYFDSIGHFMFKINNLGRGDREYASLSNVTINPYDRSIYLLESLDYLNQYDLKGDFQKKISLDSIKGILNSVIALNQDTVLLISGRNKLTYSFFSLKDKCVINQYQDSILVLGTTFPIFSDSKNIFRYTWYDNIVYSVQGTSFLPAFCFDFGKYNNDKKKFSNTLESMGDEQLDNYIKKFNIIINKISCNNNYIYILLTDITQKEPKLKRVWYNRKTKEYFVFEKFKENVNWNFFDNLIDGYFISSISAANKEEFDINLLNEKNKKVYMNVNLDDNPIIVKFKLK